MSRVLLSVQMVRHSQVEVGTIRSNYGMLPPAVSKPHWKDTQIWSGVSLSVPMAKPLQAEAKDRTVRLWDITRQPKVPKATLSDHGASVYSVAFSPDGTHLASGCGDGTVRLWMALPPANNDGVVNIADLVEVAQNFGQVGENNADINGDGIVNIVDLILVAVALGEVAAAPAAHAEVLSTLTVEEVTEWLIEAKHLQTDDPIYLRGIRVLEQLHKALTPTQTALLANYPNPFNPETWIPYQLATPADVTFRIYTANGEIVRTIPLGNMPAGNYKSQSRAAYWDGKNEVGEPVASGLYFYTLTAGDFNRNPEVAHQKIVSNDLIRTYAGCSFVA